MVQVEAPFRYDEEVEEQDRPDSWPGIVKDAVKDFVASLGESTRQMAAAAEKFAADSLKALDEAASRANVAAAASRAMAAAASEAAADARRNADSVRGTIDQAADKVRAEVLGSVEDSLSKARQTIQAAELLKADLQQQISDVASRLDESVRAGQAAMAAAQQAAEAAFQAAGTASERAERIEKISQGPSVSPNAQQVLERLDADYELLARLVQELHARIASLTEASLSPAPPAPAAVESAGWSEPVSSVPEHVAEPPARATWYQPEPPRPEPEPTSFQSAAATPPQHVAEPPSRATWYQPEPPRPEPDLPSLPTAETPQSSEYQAEAPQQEPRHVEESPLPGFPVPAASATTVEPSSGGVASAPAESPILSGRIRLLIAPVPDFDHLLTLDSALGRMSGVRNVTLADFAREEVSFRTDVIDPVSAEAFAQALAEASGMPVEVVSVTEGSLSLRLIS